MALLSEALLKKKPAQANEILSACAASLPATEPSLKDISKWDGLAMSKGVPGFCNSAAAELFTIKLAVFNPQSSEENMWLKQMTDKPEAVLSERLRMAFESSSGKAFWSNIIAGAGEALDAKAVTDKVVKATKDLVAKQSEYHLLKVVEKQEFLDGVELEEVLELDFMCEYLGEAKESMVSIWPNGCHD